MVQSRGFVGALLASVVLVTGALGSVPARAEPESAVRSDSESSERSEGSVPARIWADVYTLWIYAEPRRSRQPLGYLRAGQSAVLRSLEPFSRAGCKDGWFAVEPGGYICASDGAVFKPSRYVRSMGELLASVPPYPFHYALSDGAPMYYRLPSSAEWAKAERYYRGPGEFKALSYWSRGHEALAEARNIPSDRSVPWFLEAGGSVRSSAETKLVRRQIPHGSMLAYVGAFEHAGRTWLLSADGTLVPADRVRPFRESTFRGVAINERFPLPIAWIKSRSRPRYRLESDGKVVSDGEFPVRTAVPIADDTSLIHTARLGAERAQRFLPTRWHDEQGRRFYLAEKDATLVRKRERLPFDAAGEKWILFSITQGTLTAYQGTSAVFSTLASAGQGGVPVRGRDPVKFSTTPLGVYRITFKHLAADMSPEHGEHRSFWIANVPYTLYFNQPFAIHTAYWHENFGELMSAGCINVSPRDGAFLFAWTEPRLPVGWNGVGPSEVTGKGTAIVIVR